jgi:tetratricopeptide (TPR) repeat protein
MNAEVVLAWIDNLLLAKHRESLNPLQRRIFQQVWQGQKYSEIAACYGYTEGHIKDIGSQLWKLLSEALGEKIGKNNCRAILERHLQTPQGKRLTPRERENANFVGRESAIADLNALVNRGSKVIVIQGEGGLGKTTLAQQYLQTQGFELVLELLMAKETDNITSVEQVVAEWLQRDLQEEPSLDFGVTLGRLKRQLHTRRIGIFIDNLEPALDRQGKFIAPHRKYVELLRVLADARVQSVTVIASRDRLCEPDINVERYRLPSLDLAAWEQFFTHRQIQINAATLQTMHRAYGGNAKAMGILCGAIWEDFDGDMVAYWQENHADLLHSTDLKNLVASQFHRLQVLDLPAYRLLCRLGCYRYQDVPTIPTAGLLCLLWDVPVSQQRQTIAALRNRSLIECDRGKYWLHPMIWAEAIARLRLNDEWETANHQAAEFWTNSIPTIATTKDAIQALEAYYHYVAINKFELAGKVILTTRNNQWQQFLPLGSTLYRLGLVQSVLAAITQVIDRLSTDRQLGELYNILGDLYWIAGQIDRAIECQQKTIDVATRNLSAIAATTDNRHQLYYLKMLEIDSRLSIGLYQIDLWELETAAQLFQQVIALAQNTPHDRWAEKASVCLALVNSYLGLKDESYVLAEATYRSILNHNLDEQTGRFAYFMQILGQTYVNLGDFERANKMYDRALKFAEESHYLQVKAKIFNGLAEIHRQKSAFDSALKYHLMAIDISDRIGAKCDLAEAYFQTGLTYKIIGVFEESKTKFNRAIQLFKEMKANKQVLKVLSLSL